MIRSNAANQYGNLGVVTGVEDSSPHRLIQMLIDGALTRIAKAIGHMQRGETAAKGENISTAISIIGGLQSSLDLKKGGEIATHLDQLYDYLAQRLLEANMHDDAAPLEEAQRLLGRIKSAWDGIPGADR